MHRDEKSPQNAKIGFIRPESELFLSTTNIICVCSACVFRLISLLLACHAFLNFVYSPYPANDTGRWAYGICAKHITESYNFRHRKLHIANFFPLFCKYAAHALILCLSSIFISFWFCLNFSHYNAYFFDSFSSLPSHLRFVYCLTIVNCRRQFSDSCQILHHSAYIAVVFLLLLTSYFYYYRCCYYRNKRCRRHCYPATTAFFLVRSMCDKFECLARVDVCIYFDDGILVTLDPSHSVSAFFLLDEEKRHFKIDNVFI